MSTVELRWWKSSRSGGSGGQCVEVAADDAHWYVRDSKAPHDGYLAVASESWNAFVSLVRTSAR
jgi:hypothetical protein